ncbi:MAG: ATP-binding domain-containing protein, partial [Chlamydiia bacterium]|nr:ATP-binding domain-containing protein [Chlamydiia bacterium]
QSIYGWRGADVSNILRFSHDHIIKLEQNYRSTPAILEAANSVIQKNENRHGKKLWSQEKQGDPVEVFHAPTDLEEAQAVISRIQYFQQEHNIRWNEIAILYRSNALSRQFEIALMQRKIPYEVFGGLEFSERSEIKDLLAYLRAIANPLDQEALLRIINVPRRGISDPFLDELTQQQRGEQISLWDILEQIKNSQRHFPNHPRGIQGIRNFVDLIHKAQHRFAQEGLGASLAWLLEEINYKKAIEEEVKSEKMREFKWENAQEYVNALTQFEEETPPEQATLQHFLSENALGQSRFAKSKEHKTDKIQLMTLHSAKGLEFPICFIVGLEDRILPHEKSMKETGIEEERRLFYVGITRARKKLILSMARSRMRMGKMEPTQPSRFLYELPKSQLKITHAKELPTDCNLTP